MTIQKGTIIRFEGSWLSGLATLVIRKEDGTIDRVPCENGPTVRALHRAFGNVISRGHTVSNRAIEGKEIFYSRDDMDLVLGGFTPVEMVSPELLEAYEKEQKG